MLCFQSFLGLGRDVGHAFSGTSLVTLFIQRLQTFFIKFFYVFNVFLFFFKRFYIYAVA